MKRGYQKICILLAAADIDERDIRDFVIDSSEFGPTEIIRRVDAVRKMLMLETKKIDFQDRVPRDFRNSDFLSDTADKIAYLLLNDAKLSKQQAAMLLTKEIKKSHPAKPIPQESRKGFTNWLRKLLSIISESELLHIATRIRNDFVHDRPSDWRLK